MSMLLQDRTVLITGAGSQVGTAVASLFARHGAALALADIEPARIPAGSAVAIEADLTVATDCRRMVERAQGALGRIDILCNTAGIDPPGARTILETSEADWDRVMAVNLKAVFLCCKAVLEVMLGQGKGVIVNVASQGALRALPAMTAYGAS
jgi:NAD(P)-dependent dehydrogenase (short-subunit alcohol dehydrogenase family)